MARGPGRRGMFLVHVTLAAVEVVVGIAVEAEVEFLADGLGVAPMANSANQTCCVIRPAARLWRGQDVNQRRACIILSQQGNRCKKLLHRLVCYERFMRSSDSGAKSTPIAAWSLSPAVRHSST
jgi:hypothetical protein